MLLLQPRGVLLLGAILRCPLLLLQLRVLLLDDVDLLIEVLPVLRRALLLLLNAPLLFGGRDMRGHRLLLLLLSPAVLVCLCRGDAADRENQECRAEYRNAFHQCLH